MATSDEERSGPELVKMPDGFLCSREFVGSTIVGDRYWRMSIYIDDDGVPQVSGYHVMGATYSKAAEDGTLTVEHGAPLTPPTDAEWQAIVNQITRQEMMLTGQRERLVDQSLNVTAVAMGLTDLVDPAALPAAVAAYDRAVAYSEGALRSVKKARRRRISKDELEKVVEAWRACDGKVAGEGGAAAKLNLGERATYRRLAAAREEGLLDEEEKL